MMKRRLKTSSHKKKPYSGPFQQNRFAEFQYIRKNMKMPDDGPTVNEFSRLDTTVDCYEDGNRATIEERREVSTKNKISNWFLDYSKQIFIGVFITIIGAILVMIFIDHTKDITEHEVIIDEIVKDNQNQDVKIEKIEDKTYKLEREVERLEQKVDYNEEKSELKYGNSKRR